jgi:hypothetical protein
VLVLPQSSSAAYVDTLGGTSTLQIMPIEFILINQSPELAAVKFRECRMYWKIENNNNRAAMEKTTELILVPLFKRNHPATSINPP